MLGLSVGGPVADNLGVQSWYILGGGICILMAAVGIFIPAVMHLEDRPAHNAETAGPAPGTAAVVME